MPAHVLVLDAAEGIGPWARDALAHAGVTDLRCVLPNAPDVHDVIAQVTAMTVGTVEKLAPGAPRSPAPPPPEGWGGRSRFRQAVGVWRAGWCGSSRPPPIIPSAI